MKSESQAPSAADLTALLHQEIPLSAYMQVSVAQLDAESIRLVAPFEPNRNIHGTGFAGSLYTLCVLTGWGLVTAWLKAQGLQASVVAHKAQIEYKSPVRGELEAQCVLPGEAEMAVFAQRLAARGKARLPLLVRLGEAVLFQADFIALREENE